MAIIKSNEPLSWPYGNDVALTVRFYGKTTINGKSTKKNLDLTMYNKISIMASANGVNTRLTWNRIEGETNALIVKCPRSLPINTYSLEFIGITSENIQTRFFGLAFIIVERSVEAKTPLDVTTAFQNASMEATVQLLPQSIIMARSAFDEWLDIPGNEGKTIKDFMNEVLDMSDAATAARAAAERKREAAEALRQQAELQREEAEALRQHTFEENETARETTLNEAVNQANTIINSVSSVVNSAGAILANEEMRERGERLREQAETLRDQDEVYRRNAERLRVEEENARLDNELQRQSAENVRLKQDDSISAAEQLRVKQERQRVIAEAARVEAETQRETRLNDAINNVVNEITSEVFTNIERLHVVEQTAETVTIYPNLKNVWPNPMARLNITFSAGEEGYENDYIIQFTCPANAGTDLSLPSGIKWANDSVLEPEAGRTYQISIVDGLGVYADWAAS